MSGDSASAVGGRRLRSTDSETRFNTTAVPGLSSALEPRLFTGQQSNTSVMLGDTAILKLFRRLELGHNLDIEVHAALNAAGISDVAGLLGWIQGSWVSDGRQLDADLAMVVEMLAGAVDGWDLALDSLRTENASGEIRTRSGFAVEAEALGRALAETHQALRAAFPTTKVLGTRTAVIMMDRLREAAEIAPALAPHIPGLLRCFDHLGAETLDTQRVHGDFHLGQTLHTPAGWKIIDFEGEPAKTMAERRAPDALWRDIAGMLRSFDYAAASVPGPHSAAWAAECRTAFLRGYAGGELSAAEMSMLRAYEADKAIYEVVYETRNRPDWVGIPLRAVAALAADNRDSGGTDPPPALEDSDQVPPGAQTGELASPPTERGELVSPSQRTGVALMSYDPSGGLTGWDLTGFHEGHDTECWRRLGAHEMTVEDSERGPIFGTRFSVWAPNAQTVRLVGDFNYWNGEGHYMQLVPGAGVWALFVEGASTGSLYKFEVLGADGVWRLKADPMARFAEAAPHTASIVYREPVRLG